MIFLIFRFIFKGASMILKSNVLELFFSAILDMVSVDWNFRMCLDWIEGLMRFPFLQNDFFFNLGDIKWFWSFEIKLFLIGTLPIKFFLFLENELFRIMFIDLRLLCTFFLRLLISGVIVVLINIVLQIQQSGFHLRKYFRFTILLLL